MQHIFQRLLMVCSVLGFSACSISPAAVTAKSTLFHQAWNSGLNKNEPSLQAQQFDQNTIVIRQSLSTSFEAPFVYLLFGQQKALLIDTGDQGAELRAVVDEQIKLRLEANGGKNLELIVMHSHAHSDHVAGDAQFVDRANTVIVGHEVSDVASFFNIGDWPTQTATLDLGDRIVEIIPTPGHHDSHVMVHDRATQILFSGDTIYPGRIYFKCHKLNEFIATINRLDKFARTNRISWIMGGHIELTADPGKSFASNKKSRKHERLLEMTPATIFALKSALQEMGDQLRVKTYDDFILFPHPADPTGKSPPDWCLGEVGSTE